MGCDIYSELRIKEDYVLGHLSDNEKEAFEKHFLECDTCYQELKLQQTMTNLIKEDGEVLFAEYLTTKEKQAKKTDPVSEKVFQSPRPKFRFKYVYATAAMLILMLGSIYTIQNFYQDNILTDMVYDEQVPYKFEPNSGLRSGDSDDQKPVDPIEAFNKSFNNAMYSYRDLKYLQTVGGLKSLESEAKKLQTDSGDSKHFSVIADYYFYYGLSHYAVARSKKAEISEAEKNSHLLESSLLLSLSKEITLSHSLPDMDRIRYFLALTYGFSGQLDLAASEFEKITPESQFLGKRDKLIKVWETNN